MRNLNPAILTIGYPVTTICMIHSNGLLPCETVMGSLNTSIMHFSLIGENRDETKTRHRSTRCSNTDVLLKVHQDLAKDRLECSFDGNMRMPLLVFHSQTVFILKPVSADICYPRAVIAQTQSDVSSTTTHHSTTLAPWSMANSSWCTPIVLCSCCPAGVCLTLKAHWRAVTPVAVTQ